MKCNVFIKVYISCCENKQYAESWSLTSSLTYINIIKKGRGTETNNKV